VGRDALKDLRSRIDRIDAEIIALLKERMRVCAEIGRVKARESLPVRDEVREAEVLRRAGEFAGVFKEIIEACRKVQGR